MTEGSLILVAMVDPAAVPERFRRRRSEWPLHVTILPWFTVPDEALFIDFLEKHLPSEQSFMATVGADADFGANGEISVSLIENRQPFAVLHNYVFEAVKDHGGGMMANTWIGASYRPHVTHQGDNRLHKGDAFAVSSLTLVRLLKDDVCEVVATISLGGTV